MNFKAISDNAAFFNLCYNNLMSSKYFFFLSPSFLRRLRAASQDLQLQRKHRCFKKCELSAIHIQQWIGWLKHERARDGKTYKIVMKQGFVLL